jgi:predicted  nucleic acid-binding Zn-ribbon protein
VLKDDVAVLKDDVAVLKDDVAVLKDDVAVLKDDVAVLKDDVAVLKDDVNRRFDRIEEDAAERRVDVRRVEGQRHNSKIHCLFSKITPIAVYRPRVGLELPNQFPKNAGEF